MSHSQISRRGILGIGAGLATFGLPSLANSGSPKSRKPKKAKNIIYCVSDGMSAGVPALCDQYMRQEHGKSSHWMEFMRNQQAVRGCMITHSLSSLVTDSAAASSSWGSGVHVWNRMLNTLPDKTELRPLYSLLKEEAKMRTGLVTTCSITHATPAGFSISHWSRAEEAIIAEKYLKLGVDVLMGGGGKFFSPELREKFIKAGYEVHTNRSDSANRKQGGKFLGLYADDQIPYTIDRDNDIKLVKAVPTLAEMAESAIKMLDGSPEGFILQIEGGRVDHAAHANDFGGILFDQIAFEEAMQVALNYAMSRDDTLIVVTSDHGNSNPGLIGAGNEYFDSTAGLKTPHKMSKSYEELVKLFPGKSDADIHDLIEMYLGIPLDKSGLKLVTDAVATAGSLIGIEQYRTVHSALAIATSNATHVCWSGRQHSTEYTILTAFGPGAEDFAGPNENISVFNKLLSHRGIKHTNPTMSYEDGLRYKETITALNTEILWA